MCSTFIRYFVHSGNIVATEEMFDISAFLLSVSNKKKGKPLSGFAY